MKIYVIEERKSYESIEKYVEEKRLTKSKKLEKRLSSRIYDLFINIFKK